MTRTLAIVFVLCGVVSFAAGRPPVATFIRGPITAADTYLFYLDFEETGAPSGTSELSSGGTFNYDATSSPLSGSAEHLSVATTSGSGEVLIALPSDQDEVTFYFAHKRGSVTSTQRKVAQVYNSSTNVLGYIQTAISGGPNRAYHGSVSNSVTSAWSSLSAVWTHNWLTYRKGSGSNGYMRWLIATNDSATGTTQELIVSTGTSTGAARYLSLGYAIGSLATTFVYDNAAARAGTNSITAPPQAP